VARDNQGTRVTTVPALVPRVIQRDYETFSRQKCDGWVLVFGRRFGGGRARRIAFGTRSATRRFIGANLKIAMLLMVCASMTCVAWRAVPQ